MEDEELVENLDDDLMEQENTSSFQNESIDNTKKSVPSALQKRGLAKKNDLSQNGNLDKNNNINRNNKPIKNNNLSKNPLSKGASSSKDSGLANKLKRKNKSANPFNRRKKNNKQAENDNKEESNNSGSNDTGSSIIENVAAIKRKILLIKIGLIIGGIVIVLVILFVIIYAIAYLFGYGDEFANLGSNPNIDSSEVYYDEAKTYYEKLNKATEMYADSCGIFLNRSYIHAVLTYRDLHIQEGDQEKRYREMANNVDNVAKLMVTNCIADYEVNGVFYNNLKNSSFFKNYYASVLEYINADLLIEDIFEFAETGIELANLTSGYISDNLKVNMGTCEYPYTKDLLNAGTKYSSSVGFRSYIMGTLYAEAEDHITSDKKEFLKAFTIVTTSYALNRANYQSGQEEIWVHNGNCWQVSCDIIEGCHYTKELPGGYGTAFTGPDKNGSYWKKAISPTKKAILDEVFDEVFGTVMFDNSGNIFHADHYDKHSSCPSSATGCMGQDDAAMDAKNGMGYKEIIEKYYDNYTLNVMSEDSYAGDVTYGDGGYDGSVIFYAQTNYTEKFCGLNNATIYSHGCGVTSMAIVLSTFVDKKYTPIVVNEEAKNDGACDSSGTYVSFFKKSAERHGLGYQNIAKNGNKQVVLDALKSGNSLVIAHMGTGLFTNNGHYIVLSEVNNNGEVYVYDPYHYINVKIRGSGNGWYNFDEIIAKQVKSTGYYIITKR